MNRTGTIDAAVDVRTTDARALAFCSREGPEVFHAIAHRHEIWRPDRFDVETIHAEARAAFQSLVARASMSPRPSSGRILLLTGESGSGKTHLMRAFRNWLHGGRRGYCGYMQMTSAADQYGRYVLNNLIDSLNQPYFEPFGETSGLSRLSTALAESSRHVPMDRLIPLREEELEPNCLVKLVEALADQIIQDDRFDKCDIELVRALLYLQRDDPRLRARVLKYLRCEELSPSDRQVLGGVSSRTYADAPERVIELLGGLMGAVEEVPLVLCIDQLEDIYNLENAQNRFRRVISTVCDLADRIPSSVIVISCLEDFYVELKVHLATPARTRIEHDPRPIHLAASREEPEVRSLIEKRLEALYEPHGVAIAEDDPTYPIPAAELPALSRLPTRLILDWCREYRERCIAEGKVVDVTDPLPPQKPTTPVEIAPLSLEQLWNDLRSEPGIAIPGDETGLAQLLAEAIVGCSEAGSQGLWFSAQADGRMISVERHGAENAVDRLLVAICDRGAQGGGLGRQIAEVEARVSETTPVVIPVIVRSSDFPASPTSAVSKQLGELIRRGGRRSVVEDSDWRTMAAMRRFRERHQVDPGFAAWIVAEKPLSQLKSLRRILDLDNLKTPAAGPVSPSPEPPRPEPVKPSEPAGGSLDLDPIVVGSSMSVHVQPVKLDTQELTRHAAFLGGPGSGKTTVALAVIEQLLLMGIPAILIDRKGDLCRYAEPEAWTGPSPGGDPTLEARRAALRDRIDISVYTPGDAKGRPLSIAAVPPGLGAMPTVERNQAARFAASALGGMMNYKPSGPDQARVVILANAMELLSQSRPNGTVSLREVIQFIADADPALVNAIGMLDPKHFRKLVDDLETLRQTRPELLDVVGEPLDAEALLGLGAHARPGKTRLTIVSTKALGPNQDIQFWVAQFLMEMARWTSRSPSKRLQAVLMFDEADLYLPATRNPPSKEPMESLIKRARSAGLGLMLATQSPGDFDYKCRDNIRAWFIGRVKEPTSLAKLKPMLSECRTDVAAKIPTQLTGQFHLLRDGDVTAFRADRSAVTAEQVPEAEIPAVARGTLVPGKP